MRDRDDRTRLDSFKADMRFRQQRISHLARKASRFANLGMRKHAQTTSATRKQRSENQLILSPISSGSRAAASSAKCSGLWIRGRQEKLSDLFGLRGTTCGDLEHGTRRISSPTCSAIPLGIPMTFGWRFQQRTPCVRPAQSHRENMRVSTGILNTVGRAFCMSLSTQVV